MRQNSMDVQPSNHSLNNNLKLLSAKEKLDLKNAIILGKEEKAIEIINAMEDINESISLSETTLSVSCLYNRVNLVRHLIGLGVDLNKSDRDGWNALMLASSKGNFEVVKVIIESGADINVVNHVGCSCLVYACDKGNKELVEYLINSGSDVFSSGYALMKACIANHLDIVQILIASGVNVNYLNPDGWSSLHYASCYGNLVLVELLLDNGADQNIKNNAGKTAKEVTRKEEIKEFISNFNNSKFVLK